MAPFCIGKRNISVLRLKIRNFVTMAIYRGNRVRGRSDTELRKKKKKKKRCALLHEPTFPGVTMGFGCIRGADYTFRHGLWSDRDN